MTKQRNILLKSFVLLLWLPAVIVAQESTNKELNKKQQQEIRQSQELLSDASINLQKEEFIEAEAKYRKAIALDPKNEVGRYNLGNAYYGKEMDETAQQRYKQAALTANSKAERHKAFHNMGNTYMNQKKYTEAVEAYKNALRNNPKDDETRYNLALAKDLLEKNPPPQPDENGDEKNEDQKDDKENKDQDNKDQDKDKKDGDDQDDKKQNDEGDQKEEDKKEGDKDKDKGKPDEPKDEKKEEEQGEGNKQQQQQPVPGQLSPQQVKSLLEAMNNEEKKVQDKVNARKEKGAKIKTGKDW